MKAAHGSCLSVSAYLDKGPLENQYRTQVSVQARTKPEGK